MTEVIFRRKKPNVKRLLSFGFERQGDGYAYECDVLEGQMRLTVAVTLDGRVYSEVIDKGTEEEYILHRVPEAQGSFVGRVREEYEAILDEIFEKCFDSEVFLSEQARAVIAYVRDRYGDELEYLWQKFPDNAVVRRRDNKKWYAAILTVCRRRLGMDSDESVEILDIRISPDAVEKTVDNKKYLPGYHMNKRHWITVCLDGTVPLEEIYARIDDSYALAMGQKSR